MKRLIPESIQRLLFFILVVSLIFVLSGCWLFFREDADIGLPDQTNDNINVMLGRRDNWERLVEKPLFEEWKMAMIDGSTATVPITAELLRQFYNYFDEEVLFSPYIFHSTTHYAYERLIRAQYDTSLIFVTPPSEEELKLADQFDVELEIRPLAKDGFVFITHKDNPVDSLTVEQIQGIYSGKITNWKDLGGNDADIFAYQREPNSGSQTAMEQMVMNGIEMVQPITVKTRAIYGMGRLIEAVAEYVNGPNSIGYTYNYYINNLYKNESIKVIQVDGVMPTNENLINNTYPFTTAYYGVFRNNPEEDQVERGLMEFLESEVGQQIIQMAGYCPYYTFEDE